MGLHKVNCCMTNLFTILSSTTLLSNRWSSSASKQRIVFCSRLWAWMSGNWFHISSNSKLISYTPPAKLLMVSINNVKNDELYTHFLFMALAICRSKCCVGGFKIHDWGNLIRRAVENPWASLAATYSCNLKVVRHYEKSAFNQAEKFKYIDWQLCKRKYALVNCWCFLSVESHISSYVSSAALENNRMIITNATCSAFKAGKETDVFLDFLTECLNWNISYYNTQQDTAFDSLAPQ